LIFFDFERHHEMDALLGGEEERLAREAAQRLGEGVGNNRRFRLIHFRMLAILARWDGDQGGRWRACGRQRPWPMRYVCRASCGR
jgi:hypothetical protein